MDKKYYVYILICSDGTFYTGYTTDYIRRIKEHNTGKGAKYTRTRLPCTIVYLEEFTDKSDALKREYFIKHKMSRKEKEMLVRNQEVLYE